MSKIDEWGRAAWTFFHTMAQQVDDNPVIVNKVFLWISQLCTVLPCPECTYHAMQFLSKVNHDAIQTKLQLINILYIFHNMVNQRKHKQLFNRQLVDTTYSNNNLPIVFQNFLRHFHTKGNMRLIAESLRRTQVVREVQKELMENSSHFSIINLSFTGNVL